MSLVEIPFIVEANYDGWRLDRYLQQKLGRASRAQVQRIIRESLIQDEQRRLKPSSRVTAGLRIRILKEEMLEPAGLPDELGVLYDEEDILAVDKPAGLPVHPTARYFRGTVTTILGRDHRDEAGRRPDPAHRLDRETSGVLVCGRTKEMTRALKELFARGGSKSRHPLQKVYLALVEGEPAWEKKEIAHPLALTGAHRVRIRMSVVDPDEPGALPSKTIVEVVGRYRNEQETCFALLRCMPKTGRQHQIRAHLAAEGLPVVGDKIYGHDEAAFVRFTQDALTESDLKNLRLPRQALHALRIRFDNPLSGSFVEIEAPLPRDLSLFLKGLERIE